LHSIWINLQSSLSIMVVFVERSSLLTCSAAAPFSSTWVAASFHCLNCKALMVPWSTRTL
jgi:hypothetical protein